MAGLTPRPLADTGSQASSLMFTHSRGPTTLGSQGLAELSQLSAFGPLGCTADWAAGSVRTPGGAAGGAPAEAAAGARAPSAEAEACLDRMGPRSGSRSARGRRASAAGRGASPAGGSASPQPAAGPAAEGRTQGRGAGRPGQARSRSGSRCPAGPEDTLDLLVKAERGSPPGA
ncbi:unnamed protein product [Prorocentrum cordatum]|uniref:Uncharacterized protein n=1 Tax=Prorocentrum cordatum TaxID=2364126 RepID=A0ABN9XII2_9DINO|nr:unnamed protein product [Polarella glacialis]